MNTSRRLDAVGRMLKNNSPTILSGVAVAGVITTVVLAVRATPEVMRARTITKVGKTDMSDPQQELDDLTIAEEIKVAWRSYLPAAVSGTATIACIIGANQVGLKRNAALLGVYTLADTAFREYKDEVVKQLGDNKEQKIRDEITKKQMEERPVSAQTVIVTAGGDQLCYDSLTGRYFKSDIELLRQAQNELNQRIIGGDMYASQNDFYEILDLGPVSIGDELGWNVDNLVNLVFSSHLSDDGRPCLAISYKNLPRADYGKM